MSKRVRSKADDSACMYVGLDLRKNYLQAAVVDKKGTLLKEQGCTNVAYILYRKVTIMASTRDQCSCKLSCPCSAEPNQGNGYVLTLQGNSSISGACG